MPEEEGCERPRFKAQLTKEFNVHVPVNLVEETKVAPGDYITFEIIPAHEGKDRPCTTSHEIEAKQRMAEADEIGTATFNYYLPLWTKNFTGHFLATRGLDIKTITDIPKPDHAQKAIIVGAGPSLHSTTDEQWAKLREFDGIIIATNKALIPLLSHDVVPNWLVALDGEPVVMKSFLNDSGEVDPVVEKYRGRIDFMGPTVLFPEVTKFVLSWAKECYWGNPHMPSGHDTEHWNINVVFELINDIPVFDHGGNVGTCAWLLAKSLKCDPIAMMGFDLCAYPDKSWPRAEAVDYEYFYHPELDDVLALNGPFRAYVSILIGATDMGWNGEPPTRTVNLTPRGVLHMSGFFPNFTIEEFVAMPRDDITARATKERTNTIQRVAERVSAAKEAMKPIFRDEV